MTIWTSEAIQVHRSVSFEESVGNVTPFPTCREADDLAERIQKVRATHSRMVSPIPPYPPTVEREMKESAFQAPWRLSTINALHSTERDCQMGRMHISCTVSSTPKYSLRFEIVILLVNGFIYSHFDGNIISRQSLLNRILRDRKNLLTNQQFQLNDWHQSCDPYLWLGSRSDSH